MSDDLFEQIGIRKPSGTEMEAARIQGLIGMREGEMLSDDQAERMATVLAPFLSAETEEEARARMSRVARQRIDGRNASIEAVRDTIRLLKWGIDAALEERPFIDRDREKVETLKKRLGVAREVWEEELSYYRSHGHTRGEQSSKEVSMMEERAGVAHDYVMQMGKALLEDRNDKGKYSREEHEYLWNATDVRDWLGGIVDPVDPAKDRISPTRVHQVLTMPGVDCWVNRKQGSSNYLKESLDNIVEYYRKWR